ncbi:G-patch domain protein [Pleurostoma richardsiae]|uniref:G-patch domain protein n=1 Tax=Pleurostoma richardsiae TaxID=41990 RepID=A0AA38VQX9_9PEZI|nr:G-patch domain protein [Pleurostoma richardsiae]
MSHPAGSHPPQQEEEEEDDYMTMTFADSPSAPETSFQRRQRERREAAQRGLVKSKAQLEAEAAAARDAALSRSLLADPAAARRSKGLAMMARMGFRPGGKLGSEGNADARAEPLRIAVKEDRGGVGLDEERKRKVEEAVGGEGDEEARKRAKGPPVVDEKEYRERVGRERERARKERLFDAAQKVAERMEEERGEILGSQGDGEEHGEERNDDGKAPEKKDARKISSRPLKSINVLWRGAVRAREEAERDRRMRHDLEQGLSRLPTYEDDSEDEDDKRAMGKTKTVYVTADDLDEDDPELDDFNALDVDEKVKRIVQFMRDKYHYCFWCKYTYPDESMEGCPGITEEDHD